MATQSRKRADVTVDFSGIDSGGGGRLIPEGEINLEVVSIEEKLSKDDNPYLAWKWKVADGPYKGSTVYDNTSLQPQALWRLKGLLEAMKVDVEDGKQGINFGELKGKTCRVEIAHETYQGKDKARISGFVMPEVDSVGPERFKKGDKVTFEHDEVTLGGTVVSCTKGKAIVMVEVDGDKEEWELDATDLT